MVRLGKSKVLKICPVVQYHHRCISKYLDKDIAAKSIRKRFLDYFSNNHNHTFVKSSPVIPFCDPTVAFVNAGMNQFKGIFLGSQKPVYKRVVNSQKCVRVGGKHNDLDVVGTDGYHHTFFEMLGNWSFGDYFKKEACTMAWDLLTKEYKISSARLYVTYFGGDEELHLAPDEECKDIWRSIGIPDNRILPFGPKDNFWEMGLTGPCGPCTEIHIDHLGRTNRGKFVNKGLTDLTELWNLVFIQYNRDTDGLIHPLPQKHIDTGMGLERLAAVLQGTISNYDTDIFTKLFQAIYKNCKDVKEYGGKFGERDWNRLDTSYRILADHARMVTACLADGMIPEQNQKLRKVMRRAFLTSETVFKKESGLLKELSNYVVETLGTVYTEMEKNIKQVHEIIDYEEEVYKSIRSNASTEWHKIVDLKKELKTLDVLETPGLVSAYKELERNGTTKITPDIAFKLYDTFGLDVITISKLAQSLKIEFDSLDLQNELEKAKFKSKNQLFISGDGIIAEALVKFGATEDSFKYKYQRQKNAYVFDEIEAGILKIIEEGASTAKIDPYKECSLILDKTNFYSEAGGQCSDKGVIEFPDGVFEIKDVANVNGCILHNGQFINKEGTSLKLGTRGILKYNPSIRLDNMRNHTAIHILNAILKQVKGVTCQKSSKVTPKFLNLDVGIFGEKLTDSDIEKIEQRFSEVIKMQIDVDVQEVNSQKLLSTDQVTLIPGEVYPDNRIRLVQIANYTFISREPCCGTHVLNTSDIEEFCVINCKSLGRSTTSIHAVTGERARLAKENSEKLLKDINNLKISLHSESTSRECLENAIASLKQRLQYFMENDEIMPYLAKLQCMRELKELGKQIKDSEKSNLKEFIEMEMKEVLQNKIMKTKTNKKYLIHFLRSSTMLDSVPLQKATKLCPDIPVLVISLTEDIVKARCCVPSDIKTNTFNAQAWLHELGNIFKAKIIPPKGQDPQLVCNMKAKKINTQEWDNLLSESIEAAKKFVEKNL